MKDYFSDQAKIYATFRPTYPAELYKFILGHINSFNKAWDCATGNGQVARVLSQNFDFVFATDISQQQLNQAWQAENIHYSRQPAEHTSFPDQQFDLITVAQALHWFDLKQFYKEVYRTAKPGAWLAAWGYSNCTINPMLDPILLKFYHETVGPFWDDARKHVENHYETLPFSFEEVITPKFHIHVDWTVNDFGGYLASWSATQKFIRNKGFDPVPEFIKSIQKIWGNHQQVKFPLFVRLGKID
jgi:SAM-dependent methyltransferase